MVWEEWAEQQHHMQPMLQHQDLVNVGEWRNVVTWWTRDAVLIRDNNASPLGRKNVPTITCLVVGQVSCHKMFVKQHGRVDGPYWAIKKSLNIK